MKNVKILAMAVGLLIPSLSLAEPKTLVIEATDGISAVSCWQGNKNTAYQQAAGIAQGTCVRNNGKIISVETVKSSEGPAQAAGVISCPEVATVAVKVTCDLPAETQVSTGSSISEVLQNAYGEIDAILGNKPSDASTFSRGSGINRPVNTNSLEQWPRESDIVTQPEYFCANMKSLTTNKHVTNVDLAHCFQFTAKPKYSGEALFFCAQMGIFTSNGNVSANDLLHCVSTIKKVKPSAQKLNRCANLKEMTTWVNENSLLSCLHSKY